MPFTPTHVVAIVPIWGAVPRWLPLSALAIGSMIPDVVMFLPGLGEYTITHSVHGIFTACMPLGIGFYLLYQLLAKRPLIDLLPSAWRKRLHGHIQPNIQPTIGFFVSVAIATVIGASSHVLWDSFAHYGRWGVRQLPALEEVWFHMCGLTFTGYDALQHFSSAVFLPVLAFWIVWWMSRRSPSDNVPRNPVPPVWRWTVFAMLLTLPPLVALIRVYSLIGWPDDQRMLGLFAGWAAKTACGVILLICGVYIAAYHTLANGPSVLGVLNDQGHQDR